MSGLKLKIGASDSDRTRPIANGEVTIAGVDPDVTLMGVQALFNRQLGEHYFDVCEFPLATYLRTLERADRPYLAVPIFPSRHFRFSSVFVNKASGIKTPADMAGKRVGLMVFDMAAAVWQRGIFEEFHGLPRTAPIYVTGGLEAPRAGDEHPQYYPPKFTIEYRADESLAALLASGEIDALYTARAPSTWPSETVGRLFDEPKRVELDYYRKSGIFPPMHVLAIKRPLAKANPGLAKALFDAFAQAQQIARARLFDQVALSTMLPWQLESLLEAEREMGADYWPVGVAKNRTMLETVIRYLREDELIQTAFAPEDLFEGEDILST
jgi:4,5-dihydroxyphthalate decarboxylase